MSMAACYLAPAIVLTLTLDAAQPANQPDFSGHWQLMRATGLADAASELDVVQVVNRTTARGAPMDPYYSEIKITRGAPTSTLVETHKIGILGGIFGGMVDGTAAGASAPDPRRTDFSVRWDGNRLRFLKRIYYEQPSGLIPFHEIDETWSFDAEHHLVITTVERASDAPPRTSSAQYARSR
jgi:hypothetical protein